jgi:hypothetical protein
MRAQLRPRQLLVLMDFTSVFLTPKIGHQQQASVVQDCIVVLEFVNENGVRVRQNIDFLCDSQETNTNDYHFVLHVWISLFRFKHLFDHFDSIDIWTDGGPHHFKTRFCQWMWHWFSTQRFGNKRISHHFFASSHGHSLADAHAAAIKKILRSEYHQSQLQRFSPVLSEIHWGPASALQFGKLLQKCAKTEYCVIPWIDRDPALKPNPLPLVKIKRQHRFDYEDGKCYAAELSAAALKKLFSFRLR